MIRFFFAFENIPEPERRQALHATLHQGRCDYNLGFTKDPT